MNGQRARGRRGPVVAVTRAATLPGTAVVAALAARVGETGGPRSVVAVDDRRGPADGAVWRITDVTSPGVAERLAGADVVVHVASPADLAAELALGNRRREQAVRAAQAVATAAAAVGVRRLVVVSSAMVYGALPDNPVPLPDDAPVRAPMDDGVVGDLLEVERVMSRAPRVRPGIALTVVRPAALVGPGVDTVITRHFEAPRLLSVRGAGTVWQFCHLDDLGTAVAHAVLNGLDGALTAGCEGSLSQSDVQQASGMRRIELPEGLAFGTAQRLHRVHVLPTPASDLAFVVHPWAVASQRLRENGWAPGRDNAGCLAEVLAEVRGRYAVAGRRLERRDAAIGAAGAAVALVGTAAVVRVSRRRHGPGPTAG
jgi:nucleoside-diphosphate-sugar epimerase